MEIITSLIFSFISTTYFFGQIGKYYFEISLGILFLFNIFYHFKNKTFKINNYPFFYFLIIAWIIYLINFFLYHFPLYPGILYLIRLSILISFFILPSPKPKKNIFNLIIIANIIFGLIQYFLWPDFTYFSSLNWDPHLYRLVSTFFDPTFTGLVYLLFLIYIFLNYSKLPFLISRPLLFLSYLAMVLTYSRSTFISFAISFIFISSKLKKPLIGIISTILIIVTIIFLPRFEGEGTKLERTSSIKSKIENYREGINLYKKSPLIGFGYNNLFSIRQINNPQSHANSGFDGSLLTILITNGLIGFIFFVFGFKKLFSTSKLDIKTMILAIFIHSLFSNSLLYPWILTFLILI